MGAGANVPDLRDRFIIGAGNNYSVDATGGSADATLVAHSHQVDDHDHGNGSLSVSSHRHQVDDHNHGNGSLSAANHRHYFSWR